MYKLRNEKGISLIMSMVLLIVVGILIAAFMSSSVFNIRFGQSQLDQKRAFYAAETGVEHLQSLNRNITEVLNDNNGKQSFESSYGRNEEYFYTVSYESNNVNIDIDKNDIEIYKNINKPITFISEGNYNGFTHGIEIDLGINQIVSDVGAYVAEELELGGTANIEGDVYVEQIEDYFEDYVDGEVIELDDYDNYVENMKEFFRRGRDNYYACEEFEEYDLGFVEDTYLNNGCIIKENWSMTGNNFYKITTDEIEDNDNEVNIEDYDMFVVDEIDLSGGNSGLEIDFRGLENSRIDIFVKNGLNIQSEINVKGSGEVHFWVKEKYNLRGNANYADEATVVTHIHDDVNPELSGNISGESIFFGPESNFKFRGGGEEENYYEGSVIGRKIDSSGNHIMKYGDLLGDILEGIENYDAIFSSWRSSN